MTGTLRAVRAERLLVPRTTSWQLAIRWIEQDGVWVERGQRVIELDNSQVAGELEQRRLALEKASSDLERQHADVAGDLADKAFAVESARIAVERAELEAAVPASLLPQRDYEERQLALTRTTSALVKARDQLETTRLASSAQLEELQIALDRARREVEIAERTIAELTLEAPREGIFVVENNEREGRKFVIGDSVWVGLAVATIPDLSEMQVEAQLSDVDDGRIEPGMTVRCTLDIDPARSYSGQVAEITPVAQEESNESSRRFIRARVALDSSDPEVMRPGQSARVEVVFAPIAEARWAPRTALDWTSGESRLLLADGSDVAVELGPCHSMACVLLDGPAAGTRLRART